MGSKKSVIQVQFNWIFVLIIGAVILIFFFSIAHSQKKSTEAKVSIDVMSSLDNILTSASITRSSLNKIEIGETEVKFDCSNYIVSGLSKPIGKKILFSPNFIKDDTIIAITSPWNVPYRVTNFLYITTPNIKYIFINNSNKDDLMSVYSVIPESSNITINKEIMDIGNIGNIKKYNNYIVKVIFVNTNPDFNSLSNANVYYSVLLVNTTSKSLEFYKKSNGVWVPNYSKYFDDTTLLAAIISDYSIYQCNMKKAFERLNAVSKLFGERADNINKYYTDIGSVCLSFFSSADFNYFSNVKFYSADVTEFNNNKNDLVSTADMAISMSCPPLY